jgi:hypothetical protein
MNMGAMTAERPAFTRRGGIPQRRPPACLHAGNEAEGIPTRYETKREELQ